MAFLLAKKFPLFPTCRTIPRPKLMPPAILSIPMAASKRNYLQVESKIELIGDGDSEDSKDESEEVVMKFDDPMQTLGDACALYKAVSSKKTVILKACVPVPCLSLTLDIIILFAFFKFLSMLPSGNILGPIAAILLIEKLKKKDMTDKPTNVYAFQEADPEEEEQKNLEEEHKKNLNL